VEKLIALALTTLIGAFVGSFLGAYLKKKGENLATHEDLDKLVEQVRAVTTTTKEIEAKISTDVWDRQKQWELKRDVVFELTKRVAASFAALRQLDNFLQTEVAHPEHKDLPSWKKDRIDANSKWFENAQALNESQSLAALACDKAVLEAINTYQHLTTTVAAKINKGDDKTFGESLSKIIELRGVIEGVIRKELGIK